ncbi:MAG: hypothetical protein QXV64_03140 [Candidatus Anstonellaceae archaeon]
MSSIKKVLIIDGKEHFIEVNSSLELNEIDITATEPLTNKVIHISLNSILSPKREMLDIPPKNLEERSKNLFEREEDNTNFINEIFG